MSDYPTCFGTLEAAGVVKREDNMTDPAVKARLKPVMMKVLKDMIVGKCLGLTVGFNEAGLKKFISVGEVETFTNILVEATKIQPVSPINPDKLNTDSTLHSALRNPKVADIVSALGYLFSQANPLPPPTRGDGILPTLVMYSSLLDKLQVLDDATCAMSCITLNCKTEVFRVGSTIATGPVKGPNLKRQDDEKRQVQRDRYSLLAAKLEKRLPWVPPFLELELVKCLKNDFLSPVKPHKEPTLKKLFATYAAELAKWTANKPDGLRGFDGRKEITWQHERYLAWLYLQLSRSLIMGSDLTPPFKITTGTDTKASDRWTAHIINLLLTGAPPTKIPDPQPLQPLAVDTNTEVIAPCANQAGEPVGFRDAIGKILARKVLFIYVKTIVGGSAGQLYGHCAETLPMLYFAGEVDRFVGISLRIRYSQDAADNIKDISKMKPNPPIGGTLQFDYPCMNCRSLIHINGWNESIFHEFLRDVMEMPEPKKNSSLLQEYVVGSFGNTWPSKMDAEPYYNVWV